MRKEHKYELDPTCADLFTIALLIGARPGEIFALQKRDWNGETKELRIQRTGEYEDGRTKTATSIRILTLSAVAAAIMDRRCFGIGPDDLIFPGTKNNLLSPSNVNKKLKRWLKEAGIQKIEVVSRMLGHQNVSTTQNFYSTYTETRRKKDATEICNAFDQLDV